MLFDVMDYALELRAALSAAGVVVALAIYISGRKLDQSAARFWAIASAIAFAGSIWAPLHLWTNVATSVCFGLFVYVAMASSGQGSGIIALIAAAVFFGLCRVGGGAPAVIAGVLAFSAVVAISYARRRLSRISRADALTPGSETRREVQLAGHISGANTVRNPAGLDDGPCVAWRVAYAAQEKVNSGPSIELQTEHGAAAVPWETAELDFSDARKRTLVGNEARSVVLDVGIPLPDDEAPATTTVSWLMSGDEVFAVGVPVWEPSASGRGSYRNAPMIPVLHATSDGKPVLLADRSSDEVRREAQWTIIGWIASGPLYAAIAVARTLIG